MGGRLGGVAIVALVTVGLSGCGSSREAALEEECLAQVAAKAGVEVSDLIVDDRIKNPAGSLDWRGTYPGGEWACAGAMDSDELLSVVVLPDL